MQVTILHMFVKSFSPFLNTFLQHMNLLFFVKCLKYSFYFCIWSLKWHYRAMFQLLRAHTILHSKYQVNIVWQRHLRL